MSEKGIVVVRGGGDIATGTICRLHRCGFRVLVLETGAPTAIRRTVSLCEAIYDGETTVEDLTAVHVNNPDQCEQVWRAGKVPIYIDLKGKCITTLQPIAVVDAILAKKNFGTHTAMAPVTIALGPGFTAGEDVHAVIETARGHSLGRVILHGKALANSGIPGTIQGYNRERVVYAKATGQLHIIHDIGNHVTAGETIAMIGNTPVKAPITGLIRGLLRNDFPVHQGLKIADIDPRIDEKDNCYTISDKARCISGGVIEALLFLSNTNNRNQL
ncbi:MAG: xanthine dehydrogenase accessory factor [Desulforhopalus sp.]|jgi:xanthine dehydrogenase accessory factor